MRQLLASATGLALLLGGCASYAPDPCDLLTTADVAAEVGRELETDGLASGTLGTEGGTCWWSLPSGDPSFALTVTTDRWHAAADNQNWDHLRAGGAQSVQELGDAALISCCTGESGGSSGSVFVHQGDFQLVVSLRAGADPPIPTSAWRPILLELARRALSRF